MSQAADERTGEAAQERDAVERHFARSILAMLTATPEPSYGNGEQGRQAARPEEPPPAGAAPAAPVRPGSALTGERCLELFDAQLASRHLDVAARWLRSRWAAGHVPVGRARTHGDGTDLTIVTFGNGLWLSLRAADRLAAAGIGARVLDLRWLAPLPAGDILREANATGRVLIADETRRTGGVSEAVLAALADGGFRGQAARVTSEDSFVPLGDAASAVLLSQQAIEAAARTLVR